MIYLVLVPVFFASFAMTVREGLWSNTITLFSVIISGLIAFGFYSPLAVMLDEALDGEFTYLVDFVCIWALYIVAMVVCKLLHGRLSRSRMRFLHPIDPVAGPLVGLVVAWTLTGFTIATLHTAPLKAEILGDRLVKEGAVESASMFSSPDAFWLRFVERMSTPASLRANAAGAFKARFFVKIYRDRRKKLESAPSLKVRRG